VWGLQHAKGDRDTDPNDTPGTQELFQFTRPYGRSGGHFERSRPRLLRHACGLGCLWDRRPSRAPAWGHRDG